MWFKQHTKHKTRPKLLTFLLAAFLCLSMVTLVQLIKEPLQVQAEGNETGEDNNANPENNTAGQGAYWGRTGWLVYISDVNGNLCSPVAIAISQQIPDGYSLHFETQIGGAGPSIIVDLNAYPGWPLPVNAGGSNWREVKTYMEANSSQVVSDIFGPSVEQMVNANLENYYLVLETVSWHGVPGRATNGAGNHFGWVKLWESGGADGSGKGFYPYNKIAVSEMLEMPWPGLPAPPTYRPSSDTECIPLATLLQGGYGMAAFRLKESDGQTTADETSPLFGTAPHPPAPESSGIKYIIKNYRTINDTTNVPTDDGWSKRDLVDEHITIEEEGDYKVVGWKTSNTKQEGIDSISWPVPGTIYQQGSTSGFAQLTGQTETVLYVLLERHISETPVTGNTNFIISESTITRRIKLSYPDNGGITILKDVDFKWQSSGHQHSCTHTWYCSGCVDDYDSDGNKTGSHCPGHESHCSWGQWTDNSVTFSLKNSSKNSYPDILATKSGWEVVTTTGLSDHTKRYVSGTRSIVDTSIFTISNWDYSCVLLRGKDQLTVAQWKNSNLGASAANTNLANVSSSGFTVANSASKNRKKSLYYDSFTATFRDDSSDLTTSYSTTAGDGHGHNCGANSRSYSLQTPTDITAGVKVETYSGSAAGATNDTYCNTSPTSYSVFSEMSVLSGMNEIMGTEVQSGSVLTFRPYIQMNYDTTSDAHQTYGSATATHNVAYVIGDLDRSMTPNDYAEVSWKSRDISNPNLTIDSLQWSTHASALDFIGTKLSDTQKWRVLPGGATLDLTIKESDRQRMVVTTYQCIVDGTGKEQIDNAGGSYTGLTESDAQSSHTDFVNSVVKGLDGLGVVQWITNNISSVTGSNITDNSKQVWNISGSSEVYWGVDLSAAGHSGQTASLETKYYLDDADAHPEASASEGDLDVEVLSTTSKKYTFYVNTYGEMYMLEDNPSGNKNNEKAGTQITPGALTGTAKKINDRTHVVDKLWAAVETGTGNDASGRSKTGTNWYNEAFDGITVYVQCTELKTGFIEPPQRSEVLDPKLTQTQDNQRDMFNKDKYNMSQFKTKNYSKAYEGTEEKIGEFKGANVFMKDMDMYYFSKQFFIGNVTVDDLH